MIQAVFNALSGLGRFMGFGIPIGASLFWTIPSLGFYVFAWLFASGIGTELAAEAEHGPLISSGANLGTLLLRCVGLWLFFAASLSFGLSLLTWRYQQFFSNSSTSYTQYIMPNIISGFLQSTLGFALAFAPRIRAAHSRRAFARFSLAIKEFKIPFSKQKSSSFFVESPKLKS
ncbi:hypothetical protein B1R32_1116 [Abditibacterium utsteinense]|uniref:Uncharacterized protein n=2 Tax=Abditibacterium utsteinense TaxID=1960156 RepID=A0A2S8SRN5_9BACT|nr:hypothetical protein B1R32_1116 [Abditibacterium utsteinense]